MKGIGRGTKIIFALLFFFLAIGAVYGVFQIGMLAMSQGDDNLSPVSTEVAHSQISQVEQPVFNSYSGGSLQAEADALAENEIEEKQESSKETSATTDLFGNYYEAAEIKMESMTLQEKVGQLFLFRCPAEGAVETVTTYQPGGYVLFTSNFEGKTKQQVIDEIASFQQASKIPMAIAVDEEGGTVVRVSGFPALSEKRFQSPQRVFEDGGMNGIYNDTVEKSKLLLSLGINLNLAPVADVSTDPNDFIYDRSFGKSAKETANFVKITVQAASSQNLSSTLKHFPGYGNNEDTHEGIAIDKRSYQEFEENDFIPFEEGIKEGAQCVLVSHNIVECMDPDNPASLSAEVHRVLREELGFTGIIMTDDLVMQAIKDYTAGESPAVQAFQAGNDLLLSSDIENDFNALYEAVEKGIITEEEIDQRVRRILAWKYSMSILQ